MSSCACDLSPVTFANGVRLLRCSAHDCQTWLVDGEPVDAAEAFHALRELFTAQRRRPTGRPVRHRTPVGGAARPGPTRVRALPDAAPGPVTDEALTALLQARGLQGSWAVA